MKEEMKSLLIDSSSLHDLFPNIPRPFPGADQKNPDRVDSLPAFVLFPLYQSWVLVYPRIKDIPGDLEIIILDVGAGNFSFDDIRTDALTLEADSLAGTSAMPMVFEKVDETTSGNRYKAVATLSPTPELREQKSSYPRSG